MEKRYKLFGKGPQHVMVMHDWFSDCSSYDFLFPFLDQEAFTYAFFDLRGYGRSKEIKGEYTLEEVTTDCLELADALGWQEFHVVGHSMTGLTIQHLNLKAPKRLQSVTAITPVPATGSPIPPDFLDYIRTAVLGDDDAAKDIIRNTSGERYNEPFVSYKFKTFREVATPEARLGYLKMFSENNIVDEVKGLETPYHVIIGACDSEWHNREVMEKTFLSYFSNATLSEIADASHFPMQETPILLASLMEKVFHSCLKIGA